ncbi:MAG: ROK family protein [Clostridiales bacterium]|nr:ROK family protein [Clostridiales bacterium]
MYIAGIDIGGTNIKLGIFDDDLACVHTALTKSVRGDSAALARQIQHLIEQSPVKPDVIGAGVPGAVYRPSGKVNSGNLRWAGVYFGRTLSEVTGLKVWLDNDAQCALMAETLEGGACYGLQSAVYLTLGTGVGGALLINGRPYRGHDNAGAELGHFITHSDGLKCGCGLNGCFEMYASAGALSRMAGGVRARQALDRAAQGDQAMLSAVDRYGRELAIGVCSLYMMFRPQAIVLGGGVSAGGDILLDVILRHVPNCYNLDADVIRRVLRLANARNDAGMRGAAVLAKLNLN